jgi:hypothetical protein
MVITTLLLLSLVHGAQPEAPISARQDPPVDVSGTIQLNGRPFASERVVFQSDGDSSSVAATTDERGRYKLRVRKPGEYKVLVGYTMREVSLSAGHNQFDIGIVGGTITVRVEGAMTEVGVDLHSARFGGFVSLQPGSDHAWAGLEFGDYIVSIRGQRSAAQSVTISEASPEAAVTLQRFVANKSELRVVDADGRPVAGVVFPDVVRQPREISPGRYSLESVAAGTRLTVGPPAGFSPTCHIVRSDELRQVSVSAGRPVLVVFEGVKPYQLGTTLGHVDGIDGSECGVPLRDFQLGAQVETPEGFQVEVDNLPATGLLRLVTPRGWGHIVVNADGIVRINLRAPR